MNPSMLTAVSKIITDEFSETPEKISQLVGSGIVNRIFVVETKNSKRVVRLNEAAAAPDEYEKEVWCSRRAAEKNIPTPEILKTGFFGNSAYSVQNFIEGTEGRNSLGDKKFVWKKLGEYASRIHKIEVAGFGLRLRDLLGGCSESSWLEYIDYNVDSLNEDDELLKLGVFTSEQSAKAGEIFRNLRSESFRFGLNHGDLSLKNTILDECGRVQLLDWGSAEAAIVPHHDLVELLGMKLLENDPADSDVRAFLEGYGISPAVYREMLPELEGLLLLRAVDKLRWAIDRNIDTLEEYILQARKTVSAVLG